MKFKDLLIELDACDPAKEWASDMPIEQVVETCHRGDWLLWLAKKIDIPIKPLTLAKARCAKTVIHLMKDQRSIDAVNLAEKFGLTDEVTLDDLKTATAAAYDATTDATTDAAYAATAAYAAAYAAAYSAAAADAAAYAAAYVATDAKVKNQKQTADICRDTIGTLIIELVNNRLNTN